MVDIKIKNLEIEHQKIVCKSNYLRQQFNDVQVEIKKCKQDIKELTSKILLYQDRVLEELNVNYHQSKEYMTIYEQLCYELGVQDDMYFDINKTRLQKLAIQQANIFQYVIFFLFKIGFVAEKIKTIESDYLNQIHIPYSDREHITKIAKINAKTQIADIANKNVKYLSDEVQKYEKRKQQSEEFLYDLNYRSLELESMLEDSINKLKQLGLELNVFREKIIN